MFPFPFSTSLTVVSVSSDAISITSIASVSVLDEDFIAFDLSFKGELQRQNKFLDEISSKRPFEILQNETKIVKIGQGVLEIFNFIIQIWTVFREKND